MIALHFRDSPADLFRRASCNCREAIATSAVHPLAKTGISRSFSLGYSCAPHLYRFTVFTYRQFTTLYHRSQAFVARSADICHSLQDFSKIGNSIRAKATPTGVGGCNISYSPFVTTLRTAHLHAKHTAPTKNYSKLKHIENSH